MDLKIICSLNEDPYQAIRRQALRQDLFYRLGVVVIPIPPLRERGCDLPALICHFIGQSNRALKTSVAAVSDEVLGIFQGYPWPGNVRELAHVIEGAMNVIGDSESVIEMKHLPRHIQAFGQGFERGEPSAPFPSFSCETQVAGASLPSGEDRPPGAARVPPMETLERAKNSVEEEAIRRALEAAGGNVARAARVLGLLSPQSLHYKLKKYGLNRKDFIPR